MPVLSVLVGNLELGRKQHPVVESSIFKLQLHWDECSSLPGDFSAEVREKMNL